MKQRLVRTLLMAMAFTVLGVAQAAESSDISGAWLFSVDIEDGGHGDPTFVFKQDKEALTGSYDGPLGQYKVTGTVKDNKAVFGFEFSSEGVEGLRATYTGTIESPTKMVGTVEFTGGSHGKWTAAKK